MDSTQIFYGPSLTQDTSRVVHNDEVKKLDDLASIDNRSLMSFSSVFPFDLFPNRVVIDRNKITIIDNVFFFTRQTQSILIKDIMSAIVNETLLLATLSIVDRLIPQETIEIPNLRKSDAHKARRLLEGLLIGVNEKIDLSKVPRKQLIPKLEEVGNTRIHM